MAWQSSVDVRRMLESSEDAEALSALYAVSVWCRDSIGLRPSRIAARFTACARLRREGRGLPDMSPCDCSPFRRTIARDMPWRAVKQCHSASRR